MPTNRDGDGSDTLTPTAKSVVAGSYTVPDFSNLTVLQANAQALTAQLILTYYDEDGYPVAAPPQSQWGNWKVVHNVPPPSVGTRVAGGTQVGVMISYS